MSKRLTTKWFCVHSERPDCSEDNPCSFCLIDIKKNPFTPEQEREIEEFLDKHKELFDDLVKAGD